jgi:hypothetical protein
MDRTGQQIPRLLHESGRSERGCCRGVNVTMWPKPMASLSVFRRDVARPHYTIPKVDIAPLPDRRLGNRAAREAALMVCKQQ